MLLGEYQHNIDSKGRLIIPAKFREDLGDVFILTRGLDQCLFGYPLESWDILQEKLKQLPITKKNARAFTRMLYSRATEAELDKQGRVNIPKILQNYAELTKECLIIGMNERIEIWSKLKWDDYNTACEEEFENISEELIDFDF